MSTVLLTWELGGNAGHVHPLGIIASELKKRGHEVLVAAKNVSIAEQHLSKANIEFVQAPVWLGRLKAEVPPAVNYAELLMRVGYLDSDQVAGQIRSWLHLMKWVKPDLIMGDHSPGALLAAQVANISAVDAGSGFFSPPVETLMPSIQPQIEIPKERFIASEKQVLTSINQALRICGGRPLDMLAGIFASSSHYLLTLPETDHYRARKNTHYWGLIQSSKNAADPAWPKGDGPKVYVYMQHHSKPFRTLLHNLQQLGWPSLIVSRNITKHEIRSFSAPNLAFSDELVNLEMVAQQSDLVVTNCNHGTTVEMLQRGSRQLVIPIQVEQTMLAHRLATQGLVVAGGPNLPCYRSLLEKTSENPILKTKLKKFYDTYKNMTPQKQLENMVDDIEKNSL
jgi:UDP:flavonoid glycosyltransferase YjiC (YdhE family)